MKCKSSLIPVLSKSWGSIPPKRAASFGANFGDYRPQNGSPSSARGADCFSGILPQLLSADDHAIGDRFAFEPLEDACKISFLQ